MSYAVKEMFLTLQGEGAQAGRRAVFLRFSGCNLWSGREADRADAICQFCDTDFVGTNGKNGGKYADASALAGKVADLWGTISPGARPYVVITGGEPMLQLDTRLIEALHAHGFEIGVESNGTIPAVAGIDWLCISPKAGSEVVQTSGNELKLVWPQAGSDWQAMEAWHFDHFLIQPMDSIARAENVKAAIQFVMEHPKWRLSLQNHKALGLP
jgi:7-carboxy-7-deazaguanine synthase (Cx14CxxC type)